ncbi:MAG TPA: hypothetical protein VGL93_19360 [Streptosporangiaceae bacterium]
MTADARGLRAIGHSGLGGHGDGMQVLRHGDALYVGHAGTSGAGTSILDVADPRTPRLVRQWPAPPRTHTHKVQAAGGLLLVNEEQFPLGGEPDDGEHRGVAVYGLADPFAPRRLGTWRCGGRGAHRIVHTGGRYAYLSATPAGFTDRIWVVLDLADPAAPTEAARWWWPGQGPGETPAWPGGERYAAHHALLDGTRAYLGYGDANLVVLDVADPARPRRIGGAAWYGGDTHTCLPLTPRPLLVCADEQVRPEPGAPERRIRVLDVTDPGTPRVVAVCPAPDAAYACDGMRFGPHNLHENRPGTYRSDSLVFATYFSAGLRVYDLADPARPAEVAHWVPEPPAGQRAAQLNDLLVEENGLIWVTDRVGGGVYALEPEPGLSRLMAERAQ